MKLITDGPKVRRRRLLSGRNIPALARVVGCSPQHLSDIEVGDGNASPELAARIAIALGVELTDIAAIVDESPPAQETAPAHAHTAGAVVTPPSETQEGTT